MDLSYPTLWKLFSRFLIVLADSYRCATTSSAPRSTGPIPEALAQKPRCRSQYALDDKGVYQTELAQQTLPQPSAAMPN